MRRFALLMPAMALFGLGGCDDHDLAVGAPLSGGAAAVATLHTADGREAGRASATEVVGGLRITIDTHGLPAGSHGVHIHAAGHCDPADFASAGGHWNPGGMKHGSMNPAGPHEGDLPNLVIDNDGRGAIGTTIPGATMAALLDQDGAAIIVHATRDDLMTDPSGKQVQLPQFSLSAR